MILRGHFVATLLAAFLALAFPSAARAFDGCDVSGTWSLILATVTIRETAGALDGSVVDSDSYGSVTSGSRNGAIVLMELTDNGLSATFSGTMTDCDTIPGTLIIMGGGVYNFTLTRNRSTYCGDGTIQAGEICDDGNFENGDTCTTGCAPAVCGNGLIEPSNGESCDDENSVNGDGCTNVCTVSNCGDTNPEPPGEECDDGDDENGDGCSNECLANSCGNGVLEPGELCDDGEVPPQSGDGCSALCQFEGCELSGTWSAFLSTISIREIAGTLDGRVFDSGSLGELSGSRVGSSVLFSVDFGGGNVGEFVGSMTNCDAVDGIVTFPSTFIPLSMSRSRTSFCGDGTKDRDAGEECDDGNFEDADDCPLTCILPFCGDTQPNPLEDCDDGNGDNHDLCKNDCSANTCGDGVLRTGGEICDNGPGNSDAPNAACRTDCTPRRCGDGTSDSSFGEQCDTGVLGVDDACDDLCQTEVGATGVIPPDPPAPVTITTDPAEVGATPELPVQAAVTTSVPGTVSILVTSIVTPPQSGYQLIGKQVDITAPAGTVTEPLTFTFVVDASLVPPGGADDLVLFRNGAAVPDCIGATEPSPDDPCVNDRATAPNGDVTISVLTTHASAWNVGVHVISCGDGLVEDGEGCDDGGTVSGDGCDESCQPEEGYICEGEPSTCSAACGNGLIDGGEACDDGGANPGDGCDGSCQPEAGYTCEGEPSSCFIDEPIDAKKLLLKRSAADVEKLVFLSKDPDFGFPAIGGDDDPASGTPGGVTVELISSGEGVATLTIPSGESALGWKVTDGAVDSFRFVNPSAPAAPSAVKLALLKDGKLLKVVAKSTGLALSGSQDSVAVRITTGKLRSCALFSPSTATIQKDAADGFQGKNATAAGLLDCTNASLGAP